MKKENKKEYSFCNWNLAYFLFPSKYLIFGPSALFCFLKYPVDYIKL